MPTQSDFNPRSREGSDIGSQTSKYSFIISIHAPARGATRDQSVHFPDLKISIHAPARGATAACIIAATSKDISIHAPARGATPQTQELHRSHPNFNPRSREGSDSLSCRLGSSTTIFQSTLPRGERRKEIPGAYNTFCISIRAPARGATYHRIVT